MMDWTAFNSPQGILAIVGFAALFINSGILFVNYRSLNRSQEALKKSDHSNTLQNLRFIIEYLQKEDIRLARNELSKPYYDPANNDNQNEDVWKMEETKEKASKICGVYSTVGLFLKNKMIEIEQISMYRENILKCYNNLEGYMHNELTDHKKGKGRKIKELWPEFTYLYEKMDMYVTKDN